jgi:hypothetical protein
MATRSIARVTALFLFASSLLFGGCSNDTPSATAEPSAATTGRVEWTTAPAGEDVAVVVQRELERARKDGKDLIVYVGAKWCEPCQTFHHAVEKGQLDGIFPRLRVLEFDLDRDAERLAAAGYASRMIPLFVSPKDDGTASDRRIEGSVKGEAAIGDIAGRLRRILPRASAGPRG